MINFEKTIEDMKMVGLNTVPNKVMVCIPNAKNILYTGLKFFLAKEGKEVIWLPEYDDIVSWLTDNKGRGLLMYGTCGRGKTVLGRYVLPAILLHYHRKICSYYDAQEMNKKLDEVLNRHILSLDDIGTEGMSIKFGEKRMAFAEIMDLVEKKGKLVIVSSNLDGKSLRERYGDRIFDRLIATTARVVFNGESLRK